MGASDLADAEKALAEGDFGRGERLVRRVLVREPNHVRANELLAYVLARRGQQDGALTHLRIATRAPTASGEAWYELGNLMRARGDARSARTALSQATARDPGLFAAHHDLATLDHELGDYEGALVSFDRAARIAPNSFEIHHNRGRTLHALRRYEEALESYDRAIALKHDHPVAYLSRGDAFCSLRRYDEALADYRSATQLVPGYDDARWNESLVRLLLGEFETGWPLYECRWTGSLAWPRRHHNIPRMNRDADVAGKRVLVWWEQGFGDTLHFCRYVPMLAARGASVVFEVQRPLVPVMRDLDPRVEVIADGEDHGVCDLQVPLLSLPLAFGTTLASIPSAVPYLKADPALVRHWADALPRGPKIGIACSGHAAQKDNEARSIPLRAFEPLIADATLCLLQVDVRDADREFAKQHSPHIQLLDDRIRDFADTAAIVANMDRVVTIDTAVAHLAGALAKPTWIMLPWTPTWRWLVDREDSPWYPTARLVRQQDRRSWDDVVARVCTALRA